ncbi:MAG: aquaporin [Gemmatimonadota bacterium]|nr:aquaporin [Gemmatimonadota bacterium]
MRDSLRHFISEFVGTFALVFIGGAAIMAASQSNAPDALLQVALAHGLVYAVFVTALMRISGHFNPAVTLGFVVTRRIDPMMAGVYIVAQLLGAAAAAYILKGTFPEAVVVATRDGGQAISLDVTATQAWVLEFIATFFLAFTVFGTAVDPKSQRVGGIAIGLVVVVDMLAIGPLTGGSMNPARSFGPALASGIFEGQFIYWTAPIAGAIVASLLYDTLFIRRDREPIEHGAIDT